MRGNRWDERFRERLYLAQTRVPDTPGLEYEPVVGALVRARLAARYDEPPRDWRRRASAELGLAERELTKLQAPRQQAPQLTRQRIRLALAVAIILLQCFASVAAAVAAILAVAFLLMVITSSAGPAHTHTGHHMVRNEAPARCDPDQPKCSGDAVNQNATSGWVTVSNNSTPP